MASTALQSFSPAREGTADTVNVTVPSSAPPRMQTGPPPKPPMLLRLVTSYSFNILIDVIVAANVVMVGLEVDNGKYEMFRLLLLIIYYLELALKAKTGQVDTRFFVDFAIVTVALLGMTQLVLPDQAERLWRCSVLRLHRWLRIVKFARGVSSLFDLWLVLSGLRRAVLPIAWFALILFVVLFTGAAGVRGFIKLGSGTLDGDEYFGSVPKSVMTLLQVATLDNWASHVVRPILTANPLATLFLLAFVVVTSYGLLSLSVGVLVWSTVELARSHENHASNKGVKEDQELIHTMRLFFEAQLMMEEKDELTLRDLQDAFMIPQVSHALRQLELPFADLKELFLHLDKQRRGAITVDQFEKGLQLLKVPAARFDVACLTANIGGSVSFCSRLQTRTDNICGDLRELKTTIGCALDELRRLATSEDEMGKVPEVVLRRQGKIKPGVPPKKQRYSEEGFRRW
eukprot:TRINITY_DN15343_c0_g1_i1.p1 TRINITY_DN15343_c0_g1~~TRINITY_DN15343_c0_g1_i1.p1  ORF type:complete len:459 (+),score=122.76 TRINITY_DN15343_c0_g1_i1:73-1449(+)